MVACLLASIRRTLDRVRGTYAACGPEERRRGGVAGLGVRADSSSWRTNGQMHKVKSWTEAARGNGDDRSNVNELVWTNDI